MEILLSIVIVSSIAAALAAVLVIARKFLVNYGECEIKINDSRSFKVEGGASLLESLTQNRIFVPSACGGRGTCAYCKLKVVEGGGPVVPTEEPYLNAAERKDGVRLSCQVKVRNDLRIQIPEELFAIREYSATCTRIRNLTHDIREFRLELKDPTEMNYVPGQYIQLFCPAYDDNEEVYRAYSIASDPAEGKGIIDLVIRLVPGGICTTWCFEHLKEGDAVRLNGPYGQFRLTDTDAPMIMVAGGSGMAPMKCILHHMKNTGSNRDATYFFGANLVKELFYPELMKELEKDMGKFRFVPVVARPGDDEKWAGETGLVTEALKRTIQDASAYEGYLCGSPGMIDAAIEVMVELGMREDRIFYDKF
ncbi:MAG: 2Fe-2S iron-sulfur cluster binding domain-containing protein [Lentisphaerales bacterium]|nr:MAG: 2Fe-2S iron-sulfur cluster binding domain-containing protein [Lentisphaerales bacterium]